MRHIYEYVRRSIYAEIAKPKRSEEEKNVINHQGFLDALRDPNSEFFMPDLKSSGSRSMATPPKTPQKVPKSQPAFKQPTPKTPQRKAHRYVPDSQIPNFPRYDELDAEGRQAWREASRAANLSATPSETWADTFLKLTPVKKTRGQAAEADPTIEWTEEKVNDWLNNGRAKELLVIASESATNDAQMTKENTTKKAWDKVTKLLQRVRSSFSYLEGPQWTEENIKQIQQEIDKGFGDESATREGLSTELELAHGMLKSKTEFEATDAEIARVLSLNNMVKTRELDAPDSNGSDVFDYTLSPEEEAKLTGWLEPDQPHQLAIQFKKLHHELAFSGDWDTPITEQSTARIHDPAKIKKLIDLNTRLSESGYEWGKRSGVSKYGPWEESDDPTLKDNEMWILRDRLLEILDPDSEENAARKAAGKKIFNLKGLPWDRRKIYEYGNAKGQENYYMQRLKSTMQIMNPHTGKPFGDNLEEEVEYLKEIGVLKPVPESPENPQTQQSSLFTQPPEKQAPQSEGGQEGTMPPKEPTARKPRVPTQPTKKKSVGASSSSSSSIPALPSSGDTDVYADEEEDEKQATVSEYPPAATAEEKARQDRLNQESFQRGVDQIMSDYKNAKSQNNTQLALQKAKDAEAYVKLRTSANPVLIYDKTWFRNLGLERASLQDQIDNAPINAKIRDRDRFYADYELQTSNDSHVDALKSLEQAFALEDEISQTHPQHTMGKNRAHWEKLLLRATKEADNQKNFLHFSNSNPKIKAADKRAAYDLYLESKKFDEQWQDAVKNGDDEATKLRLLEDWHRNEMQRETILKGSSDAANLIGLYRGLGYDMPPLPGHLPQKLVVAPPGGGGPPQPGHPPPPPGGGGAPPAPPLGGGAPPAPPPARPTAVRRASPPRRPGRSPTGCAAGWSAACSRSSRTSTGTPTAS